MAIAASKATQVHSYRRGAAHIKRNEQLIRAAHKKEGSQKGGGSYSIIPLQRINEGMERARPRESKYEGVL